MILIFRCRGLHVGRESVEKQHSSSLSREHLGRPHPARLLHPLHQHPHVQPPYRHVQVAGHFSRYNSFQVAKWSRVSPLSAHCLSHQCQVSHQLRACKKVASDLGLGSRVFITREGFFPSPIFQPRLCLVSCDLICLKSGKGVKIVSSGN